MGEKGHEAAINEDELVSNAKLYLVAGTDTLALPLTYLFYALLKSPRVRARLLQEIKLAELPQQPTNDQLRAITYLDCVIDESLRLYPPIVGPLPRVVVSQLEHGDEWTILLIFMYIARGWSYAGKMFRSSGHNGKSIHLPLAAQPRDLPRP